MEPTHASNTSIPVSIFPKCASAFAMFVSIVPKCASAFTMFESIVPKCASAFPNVVSVANPVIAPLDIFTLTLLEPTQASRTSIPVSIVVNLAIASSCFASVEAVTGRDTMSTCNSLPFTQPSNVSTAPSISLK